MAIPSVTRGEVRRPGVEDDARAEEARPANAIADTELKQVRAAFQPGGKAKGAQIDGASASQAGVAQREVWGREKALASKRVLDTLHAKPSAETLRDYYRSLSAAAQLHQHAPELRPAAEHLARTVSVPDDLRLVAAAAAGVDGKAAAPAAPVEKKPAAPPVPPALSERQAGETMRVWEARHDDSQISGEEAEPLEGGFLRDVNNDRFWGKRGLLAATPRSNDAILVYNRFLKVYESDRDGIGSMKKALGLPSSAEGTGPSGEARQEFDRGVLSWWKPVAGKPQVMRIEVRAPAEERAPAKAISPEEARDRTEDWGRKNGSWPDWIAGIKRLDDGFLREQHSGNSNKGRLIALNPRFEDPIVINDEVSRVYQGDAPGIGRVQDALGLPVEEEHHANRARSQKFERGIITWSENDGWRVEVRKVVAPARAPAPAPAPAAPASVLDAAARARIDAALDPILKAYEEAPASKRPEASRALAEGIQKVAAGVVEPHLVAQRALERLYQRDLERVLPLKEVDDAAKAAAAEAEAEGTRFIENEIQKRLGNVALAKGVVPDAAWHRQQVKAVLAEAEERIEQIADPALRATLEAKLLDERRWLAAPLQLDLSRIERFDAGAFPRAAIPARNEAERAAKAVAIRAMAQHAGAEVGGAATLQDQAILEGALGALSQKMLERLAAAGYKIVVARHNLTDSKAAGGLHGARGSSAAGDFTIDQAEGLHIVKDGQKRIIVRSFFRDGVLQVDAQHLLHEIGHAYDMVLEKKKDNLDVEKPFTDAFQKEHALLPAYFHTQEEFFAQTFSFYMMDRDRCARVFPLATAAFDGLFKDERPDPGALLASQRALQPKPLAPVEPDLASVADLEKLNALRARQGTRTLPYVVRLVSNDTGASDQLAGEVARLTAEGREGAGAAWGLRDGIVRLDAATFNDPAALQKVLNERASDNGSVLYLRDLDAVPANSRGWATLKEHFERFGGQHALVLAGPKADIERLSDSLPGVTRKDFVVQTLGPRQMAEQVARFAREEGYVLSSEAMAKLEARAKNGGTAAAEALWLQLKMAQTERTERLLPLVEKSPENVSRIISADVDAMKLSDPEDLDKKIDRMVGQKSVKQVIRGVVADALLAARQKELGLQEQPPRLNLLFTGDPGTGKTTYAEYIATKLAQAGYVKSGAIKKVKVTDLVNGDPEGNVKRMFEQNKDGVIFIDEFHQLADTAEGKRAFRAIIPYLTDAEYAGTVFIGAGYTDEVKDMIREVDPGGERRFTPVPFETYSRDELSQIMDKMVADAGREPLSVETKKAALDKLERLRRSMKHFGNAGSVESVLRDAELKKRIRLAEGDVSKLTKADFNTLRAEDFADPPRVSTEQVWKEINALRGQDDLKKKLRGIANAIEDAREDGVDPWTMVQPYFALHGADGVGKKTLARLIIKFFVAYDMIVSPDLHEKPALDLQGEFVGQTSPAVRKMFERTWGGGLILHGVGGLARAGGDFKKEVAKAINAQLETYRGKFIFLVADDEDGVDAFLKLEPSLAGRFGTQRWGLQQWTASEATEELTQRLTSEPANWNVDDVSDLIKRRMKELAGKPGWGSGRDVQTLRDVIDQEQRAQVRARRDAGEQLDRKRLLPEVVDQVFDQLIATKRETRDDARADDNRYAVAAATAQKAKPKEEHVHLDLTEQEHAVLHAVDDVNKEFAELFNGMSLADAEKVRADPNSDYSRRIAEKAGVKPAAAMKVRVRVKEKFERLVQVQKQVIEKKFRWKCPYCGNANPACPYQKTPLDWKMQNNWYGQDAWEDIVTTKTETKKVTEERVVEKPVE